jgi:hypothetical protein
MFESFSELSRLYAQNYSVIAFVKTQFQRDVDAFLDEVQKGILVATSGTSRERVTSSSLRYWWIGGSDKDRHPQLFIRTGLPEIVHPGEVILNAIAPSASADQLHALAAVQRGRNLLRFIGHGTAVLGPCSKQLSHTKRRILSSAFQELQRASFWPSMMFTKARHALPPLFDELFFLLWLYALRRWVRPAGRETEQADRNHAVPQHGSSVSSASSQRSCLYVRILAQDLGVLQE